MFGARNVLRDVEFRIRLAPGGFIDVYFSNASLVNVMTVITANVYDDNAPHVVLVTINQTTKQIDLYTDLGEHLTASNAGFVPNTLTPLISSDTSIGALWGLIEVVGTPGLIGDCFFYNTVLTLPFINALFQYCTNRVGIPNVVF